MFDRLSIRTKLIAIVAAPLVVILALASLGFTQRRVEAAETRGDVARLDTIETALDLSHEVQLEALQSVSFLASEGERSRAELTASRTRTDRAAAALESSLDGLADDASAVAAARAVLRQIDTLETSYRPQVDERDGEGTPTLEWQWAEQLYRTIQGSISPVSDRLVAAIDDRDVAAGARSAVALGDYSATQARIGVVLAGAAAEGGFGGTAQAADADAADIRRGFVEAVDRAEVQLAIVSAQAGPTVRVRLRNQMAGGDVGFFSDQVASVRGLDVDADLTIDPERWVRAAEATLGQLREITTAEVATVLTAASARVTTADQAARLFLAAALLAVLLALGLAVFVAASIARPLTSLTAAADRVASEQLPRLVEALRNPAGESEDHLRPEIEQLEVGGGRELARLTESVNSIQAVAVSVATEQATMLRKGIGDMFVNLARRNQGLLDRQLEYIDELEAQEEDPDQLEHLFKLDHMATRMRRNAESLLVLAGAEPSRRRGTPVPLTKVALAAVGEIEHFARVDLLDLDECEVISKAAADIAHLLSELMENATQFSPPDARVEVVGHRLQAQGYTVSITDQGIGMSRVQLAEANELLAQPPLLGLTLARTLGFIVVGRLAARHGISVRLVASPAGGVTTIVNLPPRVLVAELRPDTVDLTSPTDHGTSSPFGSPSSSADSPSYVPAFDGASPPKPSSILSPLEFTSQSADEDRFTVDPVAAPPSTLEEAVPSGHSFDEGLFRVTGEDATADDTETHLSPVADASATASLTGRSPAPRTPSDAPEPLPDGMITPIARSTARFGPGFEPGAPAGSDGLAPLPPRTRPGAAVDPPPSSRLFGGAPNGQPSVAPSGGTHLFRVPPTEPVEGAEDLLGRTSEDITRSRADTPELTAAGLVRRPPRTAGSTRAMPGSDGGARGATTSARSPDEVRSMLSRFHTGKAAGRAPGTDTSPPDSTGPSAPDHKET